MTLRDLGSLFNSQCSGMPWNDQSFVRGPKYECVCARACVLEYCDACIYAARVINMKFMLRDTTPAVTRRDICISLLAGLSTCIGV